MKIPCEGCISFARCVGKTIIQCSILADFANKHNMGGKQWSNIQKILPKSTHIFSDDGQMTIYFSTKARKKMMK